VKSERNVGKIGNGVDKKDHQDIPTKAQTNGNTKRERFKITEIGVKYVRPASQTAEHRAK